MCSTVVIAATAAPAAADVDVDVDAAILHGFQSNNRRRAKRRN